MLAALSEDLTVGSTRRCTLRDSTNKKSLQNRGKTESGEKRKGSLYNRTVGKGVTVQEMGIRLKLSSDSVVCLECFWGEGKKEVPCHKTSMLADERGGRDLLEKTGFEYDWGNLYSVGGKGTGLVFVGWGKRTINGNVPHWSKKRVHWPSREKLPKLGGWDGTMSSTRADVGKKRKGRKLSGQKKKGLKRLGNKRRGGNKLEKNRAPNFGLEKEKTLN